MLLPVEWRRLETVTLFGPDRYGIAGEERLLLYHTAIQTRLRAAIAMKAAKASVFALPHPTNVARMLRKDLAEARKTWIKEAENDPDEYAHRNQSDFLAPISHDGERLDFHSLRHSCGAWLASTGAHPKTVQVVMRHSSITLTMDCYGHLFPGQEAEAVAQVRELMSPPSETLQATGTDDQIAQTDARRRMRSNWDAKQCVPGTLDAKGCDEKTQLNTQVTPPKPLKISSLGDMQQRNATGCESGAGGTRTPNQRIMSPLL